VSSRAALDAVSRDLAEACEQARLAYEFAPCSYSFSAVSAAYAARHQFEAYRAVALEREEG